MNLMFSLSGIFMLTKSEFFGTNHHDDKDISVVRIIRDSPLLFSVSRLRLDLCVRRYIVCQIEFKDLRENIRG